MHRYGFNLPDPEDRIMPLEAVPLQFQTLPVQTSAAYYWLDPPWLFSIGLEGWWLNPHPTGFYHLPPPSPPQKYSLLQKQVLSR